MDVITYAGAARARVWPRRLAWAAGTLLALAVLFLAGTNLYVLYGPHGASTADVERVPHAQAAIVLGAQVEKNGHMSPMLADRVQQAIALWDVGKVNRILVSGDHTSWAYDEPDTMRKALVAAGVPPRVIFEDHAGFDTWASMVRAKKVFEVRSAVVVTQGFHMPRALFLAHEAGLPATGLTADLHDYGTQGWKSRVREILSRSKAVVDAVRGAPVDGGPAIPISGDNGRVSWDPAPPEGTPLAGSPGR
jgi:SanA protein